MTTVAPVRRYPRWQDGVGAAIAGLWPIALTLAVLRNPGRYNPFALYSGFGTVPVRALHAQPTTDPGIFTTQYTLGVRAATLLVHGHVPWWNPFEALGAPLIGEMESGGLFPFTPLLLLHDGSLIYHLVLAAIAGVATFWLLREFRCGPVVATLGGMLFATNGTYAWLANAVSTPICFLPIMLLGVERARRAAAEGRGGGWRWLAVGAALALLAGFIEVAALGLIFVTVVAVQRGWTLGRAHAGAFARKAVAGLACGMAIASPLLVAFNSYLSNGYVAEHAGNPANHGLATPYVAMTVSPYLFGRIGGPGIPMVHQIWGAVGGYAGFALLALAVASLFGRRDRGLRIVLASWVGLALADSVGAPGVRSLIASVPVTQHIVLYRYLPPTWELALVLLAAFALRDLATSPRTTAVVAVTTGVLVAALVLLAGMALAPAAVDASRSLASTSMHQSELLVVAVAAGLVLAATAPARYRGLAVGVVAVVEAAILFAIPLASWPTHDPVDQRAVSYLTSHVGSARFYSLGTPTPNFGSEVGLRQLNVVDLPIPTSLVPLEHALDPFAPPTRFTGTRGGAAGLPTPAQELLRNLHRYELLGVRFVVAPTADHLFAHRGVARLVYQDPLVAVWQLDDASPLAHAGGCGLRSTGQDSYVASCVHRSTLVRSVLSFPGWSATVNGRSVPVIARGRFQAVELGVGHSVVAFTYLPPDVPLAAVVSVLALLSLLVPYDELTKWRRRRRSRTAWSGLFSDDDLTAPPVSAMPVVLADAPEPATGAIAVVRPGDDDEPATSAVPAVTGSTAAVGSVEESDGPPTSAVAVDTAERPRIDDPPTIAVPVSRAAEPTVTPDANA